MCEHGAMIDLGEPCDRCGITYGPRDRHKGGMVAAVQCPICPSYTATPIFETHNGHTTTFYRCVWCGMEFP